MTEQRCYICDRDLGEAFLIDKAAKLGEKVICGENDCGLVAWTMMQVYGGKMTVLEMVKRIDPILKARVKGVEPL